MSSYSDSELRRKTTKCKQKSHISSFKAKHRYNERNLKGSLKSLFKEMHLPQLHERRLLTAVGTNNTELMEELLMDNVDPNSKDRQHRSALHLAVSRGYKEAVTLLLQYGADVNSQDIIGNTPLHLAACTSNLQLITLLLSAGADVSSLDMHGRNPLQLAESKLHILRYSWKSRTIEMIQLRDQLQQIVDVMISLWKIKYKNNVDDLEMIKLSINSGPEDKVDDQMARLLEELRDFSLK
ncbi:hypothetical protein FQA39_LY05442 [Lamprigera yunnana]|nr:hypothetical protein FQA39_LY05442 [Lamprigera yunnana]